MDWTGLIILFAVGLFLLLGAIFNWDWFFNSRRARTFVNIFGRTGARVFYIVLSTVIIIMAIYYGINSL